MIIFRIISPSEFMHCTGQKCICGDAVNLHCSDSVGSASTIDSAWKSRRICVPRLSNEIDCVYQALLQRQITGHLARTEHSVASHLHAFETAIGALYESHEMCGCDFTTFIALYGTKIHLWRCQRFDQNCLPTGSWLQFACPLCQ